MSLDLAISIGLTSGGAQAFTPAVLFAGGVVGAWYDPSDFSTLFQDTAGATPVTAAGQSVALIKDKSGNGNHVTQATALNCPTYQVDGSGKPYLAFAGGTQSLTRVGTIGGTNHSFGVAGQATAGVNNAAYVDTTASSDRLVITLTPTNFGVTYYNGVATAASGAPGNGVNAVGLAEVVKGSSIAFRMNGAAQVGTSSNSVGTAAGTALGATIAGTGGLTGRIYGFVQVARSVTTAERAKLETWLGLKCGLTF